MVDKLVKSRSKIKQASRDKKVLQVAFEVAPCRCAAPAHRLEYSGGGQITLGQRREFFIKIFLPITHASDDA